MKRPLLLFLALLTVGDASAALLRHDEERTITYLASANRVEAFREGSVLWSARGTATPAQLLVTRSGAAIVDVFEQKIVWVDVNGKTLVSEINYVAGEAITAGDALIVSSQTDGALWRYERGEEPVRTPAEFTAAILRLSGDRLVAYDRITGVAGEFDLPSLQLERKMKLAPFASDIEVSARHLYLALPRAGEIHVTDRMSGATIERIAVGAVPVDVALAGKADLLGAGEMLVADPSSKRVWREEQRQSTAAAVGRGFTRGLIGLGLYTPKSSEFPTGVDRVMARGKHVIVFDSSSGTLYRLQKGRSRRVAAGLAASEFELTANGTIVMWDAERRRVVEHPLR